MFKSIKNKQAIEKIIYGLAITQLILQLILLSRGVEYIVSSLTIDDTYYYLQPAWNLKELGFVTFDGLHATNGVQLAWFAIIAALATISKSKIILLYLTLIITIFLNVTSYLFILKLGKLLNRSFLTLSLASFWFLLTFGSRTYLMGMENSLHALLIWVIVWQMTIFITHVKNEEKPNYISLTVVLILNVWTRLDAALLSGIIFCFCMGYAWYHQRNTTLTHIHTLKYTLITVSIAGFAALIQFGTFWLIGDSLLPVSALIKTSQRQTHNNLQLIEKVANPIQLSFPLNFQALVPWQLLILGGIFSIIILVMYLALCKKFNLKQIPYTLLLVWATLFINYILYHALIIVSAAKYPRYFFWYRSPLYIFWILTFSLIIELISNAPRHKTIYSLSAGLSLLLIIFSLYQYTTWTTIPHQEKIYLARYHAAQWMKENSSKDNIYASWNAGQLGYFSDRHVINLDGLINHTEYYQQVLQGNYPLKNYLIDNKVNFVIDYVDTIQYENITGIKIIHTFPEVDAWGAPRYLKVWELPVTQANSLQQTNP